MVTASIPVSSSQAQEEQVDWIVKVVIPIMVVVQLSATLGAMAYAVLTCPFVQ